MLEQSVSEGLHPIESSHAGDLCEEMQPVENNHYEGSHVGPSLVGGIPH